MAARKTILERIRANTPMDVPYHVWTVFGNDAKQVFFGDNSACFGSGDYKSEEEIKVALEWYVHQMGGQVTWEGK